MTSIYETTRDKEKTIEELRIATRALIENDIDIIICEVNTVSNKKNTSSCF